MTSGRYTGSSVGQNMRDAAVDATNDMGESGSTAGQWLGVMDAATAMGVHVRTIERRLRADKLQSRRHNDRVEVWVGGGVPEAARRADDVSGDAAVPDNAEECRAVALAEASTAVSTTAALADRLVGVAEADARRARRWSGITGVVAGVLAVAVVVLIWWVATVASDLETAQTEAAHATRTAADTLTNMSGRLADATKRAQQAESRAVAATTEARQAHERAVLLEQQLTEASASVEIALAKQQAAEDIANTLRRELDARRVAAAVDDGDVPGGGVEGQQ